MCLYAAVQFLAPNKILKDSSPVSIKPVVGHPSIKIHYDVFTCLSFDRRVQFSSFKETGKFSGYLKTKIILQNGLDFFFFFLS